MKTRHFSIFLGILLASHAMAAQLLNVRALAMASEPEMSERYLKTEKGYAPLVFSAMQPSEVMVAVAGAEELPLFELKQSSAGLVTYELVEKVKLPAKAKGVLLLGWPTAEGERYLAIDDDYLSAKYDDWLLINASAKRIAFQTGLKNPPVALKPNSVAAHKIKSQENTGVAVIGRAEWGEKVKTFHSSYWAVRSGERGIVVFYELGDRIALKKITDVLLKPEEKKSPVSSQAVVGK